MLVLNLAFENINVRQQQKMTVSKETVCMAKFWPRKNQSKRTDLPCHIIISDTTQQNV